MNVMIIGSGGREHALAWKASQSKQVEKVYVIPGNAGTAQESNIENVALDPMDFPSLVDFANNNNIELTIIGPEVPLVAGIVNYFQQQGLLCFGPSQGAAQLEGSKAFSKDFLQRHNIPTAAYQNFTKIDPAIEYLKNQSLPIVIKADGLAAGKGVIIAQTLDEAIETVKDMLSGNSFGDAGHRVVIEEFMRGEEASFIAIVDGLTALPFASSQDHKARDNGDLGPNTGGMGAYSPAPVVTPEIHERIMQEVIIPTVKGMAEEGNTYVGFLYAGVMISPEGQPKVVEFNCRFGDPEAQPVMMRLQSDLVELCQSALKGELDKATITFDPRPAVGVVLAAGGYPNAYAKGKVISGLDSEQDNDKKIFHAGTAEKDGDIVTNGGRVLCATAMGDSVTAAQQSAYRLVDQISWDEVYYRTDIAYRAIERELN
ncbi:MAG: phosphoribosylamine--glycine ligase [SAR86 cluster bacterium]|uniref:Phosphoribosylamine--glycine ligase n=1 Tax=SAR86 cluster bacterium TaxID=2030880 RepID=A0A2A5CEA1_9GAMM|nr:phosphoribosylamine--glycine ligase [Gammaproteobacteria bacterium AH-315-E17]PCJ41706.1 MAG: phosphoribosylamine--glycine ligase [SAR86 cluster bacterium]